MESQRDQNRITSLLAVSSLDLTTPVTLIADPISHVLQTTGGLTYTDGQVVATPSGNQIFWNESGTERAVSGTKPLPVDIKSSVALNITNITGTVSLPTGASTSALQTTGNTSLSSIDTKLTGPLPVSQSGTWTVQPGNTANTTAWLTTGTAGAFPVQAAVTTSSPTYTTGTTQFLSLDTSGNLRVTSSGGASSTVDVNKWGGVNTTLGQKLMASSVPVVLASDQSTLTITIPTGASTSALQTTGNTSLSSIDTKLTSPLAVSQSGTWTVQPGNTANTTAWKVDGSAVTQPVSMATIPVGAATSTLQTTGNTSLSSIDTKTPALGQALETASVPVVLTAAQLTTLTPPAAITGFNLETTQLLVKAKTDNLDVLLSTRLKPSDTLTAVTTVGTVSAVTTLGDITGTVSLPTGASTSALQTTQDTSINSLLKPASTLTAVTTVGTVSAVTAITNALPVGTNTIGNVNQTLATAGFSKITDGTNTMPTGDDLTRAIFYKLTDGVTNSTLKPASITPLATDTSLVVSLSPNISTVATSIAKAEDAIHTTGDVGIQVLGVRNDASTTLTSASGDYSPIATDNTGAVFTRESSQPTFHSLADRITPAANKYLGTIFNTSATRKVVIQRVYCVNTIITASAGIAIECYLTKISARTSGSTITPRAEDSNDTISAGITADHTSTAVTESFIFRRFISQNEEPDTIGIQMAEMLAMYPNAVIYEKKAGYRGITLRQNEGISIRQVTATTVGNLTVIYEFTDEPA